MSNEDTYYGRVTDRIGVCVVTADMTRLTINASYRNGDDNAASLMLHITVDDAPLLVEKLQEALAFIAAEQAAGER